MQKIDKMRNFMDSAFTVNCLGNSIKPINVAIYQPVIPEYRIPFFTALQRRHEINIQVFASVSVPGAPDTPQTNFEFSFHPVKYRAFLKNRLAWQSGFRIPDYFKRGDVIVVCANPRFLHIYPLMLAAKKRRVGFVWWGHGHTPGPKRLSENIRKFIMKFADVLLLYTDKEVEEYRREGFPNNRLFATNNTINVSEIEYAKEIWNVGRLTSFKKQHGLKDSKIMLYCGRLTSKCELSVALEALLILLKKSPSYCLAIIGDGPEKDALVFRANELNVNDAVHWCGAIYEQAELAPWFLSASVFVYPGSIGLSLLHSFSYSLPVVTHSSAEWHNPEIAALRSGHNGFLFKRGDAVDLACKIDALASDPMKCQQMGANALATIKEDYSFENMVDRFLQAVSVASAMAGKWK